MMVQYMPYPLMGKPKLSASTKKKIGIGLSPSTPNTLICMRMDMMNLKSLEKSLAISDQLRSLNNENNI